MKTVTIKNVTFGSGMPKIALPVEKSAEEEIVSGIQAASSEADLIELRADAFKDAGDAILLKKLLAGIRRSYSGILLFTLRTCAEGGRFASGAESVSENGEFPVADYSEVIKCAIESGCIDMIDIEYRNRNAPELIRFARKSGIPVVLSAHDFRTTPSSPEILKLLQEMEKMHADIAKAAFWPEGRQDTEAVLSASRQAKEFLSIPYLLISMGDAGKISRVCGEEWGSCITFGSYGNEKSAPGQMDAGRLRIILQHLHEKRSLRQFIFLTGFMGTGKTSAASALHERTGMPVLEMDETIEKEQGLPISRIFELQGEEYFRNLETQLLLSLNAEKPCIVSCGGGAVLRPDNARAMHSLGKIVLLTAQPETVYERLKMETDNRPNLKDRFSIGEIRRLLSEREAAYRQAADFVVATDGKSPYEAAQEINFDIATNEVLY